jgi:transposase
MDIGCVSVDDVCMSDSELWVSGEVAPLRRRRSAEERRRIVEETFETGASVSRVARLHGVNANQVFAWRRMYRNGELSEAGSGALKLLPVSIAAEALSGEARSAPGLIHIELPGRALLTVEGSVDASTIQAVLKSLLP